MNKRQLEKKENKEKAWELQLNLTLFLKLLLLVQKHDNDKDNDVDDSSQSHLLSTYYMPCPVLSSLHGLSLRLLGEELVFYQV